MRLIVLGMLVFLGQMAQSACQMSQTNVVTVCTVNDSSSERVDRIVERVSKLEAQESATSAATIQRVAAVETACEQIRSRVEKLNANNSEEIGNRAEAFYATRYKELKESQDEFIAQLNSWFVILGIVVALLGAVLPISVGFLQHRIVDWQVKSIIRECENKFDDVVARKMATVAKDLNQKSEMFWRSQLQVVNWEMTAAFEKVMIGMRDNGCLRDMQKMEIMMVFVWILTAMKYCAKIKDIAVVNETLELIEEKIGAISEKLKGKLLDVVKNELQDYDGEVSRDDLMSVYSVSGDIGERVVTKLRGLGVKI